jgi:hypothetical protein
MLACGRCAALTEYENNSMIFWSLLGVTLLAAGLTSWAMLSRKAAQRTAKGGRAKEAARRDGKTSASGKGKVAEDGPRVPNGRAFSAVEIRLGGNACRAAQALAGTSLLAAKAPVLPLPDCTESRCRCSFEKLDDRRQDSRRWIDHGLEPRIFSAAERRKARGRRRSDRR